MNTLDLDAEIWEVEVEVKTDTLNPTSRSKYQLSTDSRRGLVPGGENSMEAEKLRVQSPPGYMASWVWEGSGR